MHLNWKLILQLSAFGLAMAIASVWYVTGPAELGIWLVIFALCGYAVAKNTSGNYFLHGFLISMVNCVWVTSAHILFFHDYAANHPEEMAMNTWMPTHPRLMMAMMGPMVGIFFGLILGLFCFVASKILKK